MSRLIGAIVFLVAGFLGGYLLAERNTNRTDAPAARAPASDSAAAPDGAASDSAAATAVIGPGPVPRLYRSLMDSASVNVDGDSTPERVELYAEVDRDPQGRPMWDDGQQWMLLVRRGGQAYVLFDELVQLGTAGFTAVEHASDAHAAIVLELQAGSGVVVQSFVFDPRRGGFVRAGQLQATGMVVHRPRLNYDQPQ